MMAEQHVEASREGAVQVIRFVNEKTRNSMTAEWRAFICAKEVVAR